MNLISGLYRFIYMPLCRTYVRWFVGDEPADSVLCNLAEFHFWRYHGYWPHFRNPRSFEEKVCARMLFDRNPLWTTLCDKLRVREYVKRRSCGQYLVPILWEGEDPDHIPFEELPSRFVIKATHGCGYNIIVKDHAQLDHKGTRKRLRRWLRQNFCQDMYIGTEWGYRNIHPTIIIEAFIGDDDNVPIDYKFFCFNGRVEYVLMNFDRFGSHSKEIVDRDFNPTGLQRGQQRHQGKATIPNNYGEMITVAETLAQNIDFIRVDLYNISRRIYFGELTCYPGAGIIPFIPRSQDFAWGEKWKLSPFLPPATNPAPDN